MDVSEDATVSRPRTISAIFFLRTSDQRVVRTVAKNNILGEVLKNWKYEFSSGKNAGRKNR